MTDPSLDNGYIRFRRPKWLTEFAAMMLAAAVSFGATHFYDSIISNKDFQDRMNASERDRAVIHEQLDRLAAVQITNSEFRESAKVELKSQRDMLLDVKSLMIQHVQQEQADHDRPKHH